MTIPSAPALMTEAAGSNGYPANRFNERERQLLASVANYLNAGLPSSALAAGSVTLSKLATGVSPAYIVVAAGTTAVTGSATTQSITVTGALTSDIGFAMMNTADTNAVVVKDAKTSAGALGLTYSASTGTGGNVSWFVLRAAS